MAKIITVKNARAWVSKVSYSYKQIKNKVLKRKNSWESFRICLLNSTADPAKFPPNWEKSLTAPRIFFSL